MMNSRYYEVNYAQYAMQLLTNNYRIDMVIAIIKAMAAPLDEIHSSFDTLRQNIDFNTYSQVCYMQGLLNDNFDPLERRIRIRNASIDYDYYLLHKRNKKKPVRLARRGVKPYYWCTRGMLRSQNIDFKIILPVGYSLSEEEENSLRNLVNQSKLASKRYIITNDTSI